MGIKHFFSWYKHHPQMKHSLVTRPSHIDHLLIDMNGIIHESAQFIYRW